MTISGRSEEEKSNMQSLKPELNSVVFNCCKIDIPMKSGKELSPNKSLSHK